jgi:hypothetical protein
MLCGENDTAGSTYSRKLQMEPEQTMMMMMTMMEIAIYIVENFPHAVTVGTMKTSKGTQQ